MVTIVSGLFGLTRITCVDSIGAGHVWYGVRKKEFRFPPGTALLLVTVNDCW